VIELELRERGRT